MTPTPARATAGCRTGPLLVAALVLAACGTGGDAAPAQLEVHDAWARASATGQVDGAAYLEIHGGPEPDALIGASAPAGVAAATELHESTTDLGGHGTGDAGGHDAGGHGAGDGGAGGMVRMRRIASIPIPADGTVAIEPGRYHLMLVDLAGPLDAGARFNLTLHFEHAGTMVVPVAVRPL